MDRKEPGITEDLIRQTDRWWEDPRRIMNLLDILFLWEDDDERKKVKS